MGNIIVRKTNHTFEIINKLQRNEKLNSKMYDVLRRDESNKFLIPHYNFFKRTLKVNVSNCQSLREVLSSPIDKNLFFKIIYQSIMIIELCQRKRIDMDNLDLYLQNVYISCETQECYFIFWPIYVPFAFDNSYDYFYQIGQRVRIKGDKYIQDEYLQYFKNMSELELDVFKRHVKSIESGRMTDLNEHDETNFLNAYLESDGLEETTLLDNLETTVIGSSQFKQTVFPKLQRELTQEEYMIQSDEYLLGKDESCDCCIKNNVVSRKHAKILFHDRSYFIIDCHSTNGTYVDDILIEPDVEVELYIGSTITLANEKFIFTF